MTSKLTRERVVALIAEHSYDSALVDALEHLLAAMDSEPVAWMHSNNNIGIPAITTSQKIGQYWMTEFKDVQPLYRHAQQPVVPDALADAFIAAIEKEQDRLHEEDYLMDSKDCIDVIREEVQRLNANRTTMLNGGKS